MWKPVTARPGKGDGEPVYETLALLPPQQATSPAARALMALLEQGTRGEA